MVRARIGSSSRRRYVSRASGTFSRMGTSRLEGDATAGPMASEPILAVLFALDSEDPARRSPRAGRPLPRWPPRQRNTRLRCDFRVQANDLTRGSGLRRRFLVRALLWRSQTQ